MAKSDSPAAYADVKYVMDLAVKKPGLRYEVKSHGAATNFKQRCNKYRNILRDMATEQLHGVPGMRGETVYDTLVIRQQDADGKPSRTGRVLVFDHHQPEGKIIDPDTGEELNIAVEGLAPVIKDQG